VLDAVAELDALAVTEEGIEEQISGFLSRDDTVVARMAAAVDLAEASGLDLGLNEAALADCDDPAAHLPRATRWQRYGLGELGPLSDLRRACAADIARGSLRRWSQTRGDAW
jgi:hypothetical protein